MRALALLPIASLLAGCWTPGPGQLDPTRYPWDQRPLSSKFAAGTYCVVALQPVAASGIVLSGNAPTTPGCGSGNGGARLSYASQITSECWSRGLVDRDRFQKYHALLLPHDGIRISRADWAAMSEDDRARFIWHSAVWESCQAKRPITFEVHIRDLDGKIYVRQRVNTGFACHGDHATMRPGETWYRC